MTCGARVAMIVVAVLCWIAPVSSAASSPDAEPTEMLHYLKEGCPDGAFCTRPVEEVTILTDGTMAVRCERSGIKTSSTRSFRLNSDEITALRALMRSTILLLPDDTAGPTGLWDPKLRITLDGKTRETWVHDQPKLHPLLSFVRGFVGQWEVLFWVEDQGDADAALNALDPKLSGGPIPQPQVLKEPLKQFVHTTSNTTQLGFAIQALCRIMTPYEWLGFFSREITEASDERAAMIISNLSPCGGDDNSDLRMEAARSLAAEFVRATYRRYPDLSKNVRWALDRCIDDRLRSAIIPTLLVENYEVYKKEHWDLVYGLPKNQDALRNLSDLLDHKDAGVRVAAMEVIGTLIDLKAENLIKHNRCTPEELDKTLAYLRGSLKDRIRTMMLKDTEERVRASAEKALAQIERGWK